MAAEVSQQPTAYALGDEPAAEEVAVALRSMGNSITVGLDQLPVEFLKLGLHHYPTVLREFYQIIIRVWREGQVPQRWRDAVIKALHKKGPSRVRELPWYLSRDTRGQSTPQNSR